MNQPSLTMTSITPQPMMTPDEIDRLARKRAGAKLGWYIHAGVYIVVNLALFLLASEAVNMGRRPWNIYPAMGWGLGLFCTAFRFLYWALAAACANAWCNAKKKHCNASIPGAEPALA